MTPEQFEDFYNKDLGASLLISGGDLTDKSDRTLIYGYDLDRNTWHVYLKGGVIYKLVFNGPRSSIISCGKGEFEMTSLVPPKRAYPNLCDYEFCKLLLSHNISISFTTYDHNFPQLRCDPYEGLIFEDMAP